jgi:ABC-type branched-subunit amino acid transport system ATPase component
VFDLFGSSGRFEPATNRLTAGGCVVGGHQTRRHAIRSEERTIVPPINGRGRNHPHRRRGGDLSGGQQQLAIDRALVMRPRLLLLDKPAEGIQPSIIKDIGRAISYLRGLGDIAIVLVEQYLDFAQELGDYFAVMDSGQIVYSSTRAEMDDAALKRALAI